jgi:hypothetical protein
MANLGVGNFCLLAPAEVGFSFGALRARINAQSDCRDSKHQSSD